jgi:tetratricopeptide (TPR) repeat protein
MSDISKLPTASDAQNIGFRADKCFVACCPETWLPQNVGGTDDFGIDYQVQTLENGHLTDMFRVQLKGTTVPSLNVRGSHFSIQLKASTIRYYARFTEPILLVLCDLSVNPVAIKCPLYYVWIHDELRRINSGNLPNARSFVNLHIPTENVLNGETNLSKSFSQFRALANIGASLDMTLERREPSLDSIARAALIEKLPDGFSTRSAALMESLAEEPATVWPDRPVNSMAWFLYEAEQNLNSGGFARAEEMLASAYGKLGTSVSLEVAEYWHLKGRAQLANLSQEAACEAFERAIAAEPNHPKYVAAWAETKFGIDFCEDGRNDFSEIYSRLTSPEPAVQSIRARILAAEKRYSEAEQILETLSGAEELSAQAILHTMRSRSREAVVVCETGLSLPNVKYTTRLLFVILKARAKFNLAVDVESDAAHGPVRMPLTGKPGADLELLLDAWEGMKTAIDGLRAAGWPANIEFVADILCAAASILDKEEQALAMLSEAAEKRPALPVLQAAVESLAAQTGNFELAMKANSRQPQNSTTKLRKACLLHMTKKDAECVSFFESQLPTFDQADPMFGEALTLAVTSADRLVKTDLVKAWLALFNSRPELAHQRAVWEYFSTVSKNKAKRAQALAALFASFERYEKPLSLAIHLFHALNPHRPEEAVKIIAVAKVVMEDRLFPLDAIFQLGQAFTTLEQWPELLSLSQEGQRRFGDNKILVAVTALALDRLGRTAEARDLLSPLIALGVTEPFILGTHIEIATRCGFIEEAIKVAEMMLSLSNDNEKKIEHLRLLHNLVRAKNPSDPRAYDIAWRVGELTSPNDEIEEGKFLMMLMVSNHPEATDLAQIAESQERFRNYRANFPHSSILRSATIPENATPDELLTTLMKLVGDTPEELEARQRRDDQLNESERHIPFAWRPNLYANLASDLPQLWEISKKAKGTDWRVLLSMISGQWTALPWSAMRDRVPLMDLLSLQLAQDLDILDLIFRLFPKVAVPHLSMSELGKLADPLVGSIIREKCLAIQATLQNNFGQLLQPRMIKSELEDAIEFAKITDELKGLSRQSPYLLYSDDAYFRIFCQEHEQDFQSVCVLDILSAMEEQCLLTTREVAEKVGMLCAWGVGVAIEQRWQVASLPENLGSVPNVAAGVDLLQASQLCISIFDGMWDRPNASYSELLTHAGGLVASMLIGENQSAMSIASLMVIWHTKAIGLPGAPHNDLASLALLVRNAAATVPGIGATPGVSTRLWRVFLHLVTHIEGKALDEIGMVDSVMMLAGAAANHDLNLDLGRGSLKTFFDSGLRDGSATKLAFKTSYKLWRRSLIRERGLSSLGVNHYWQKSVERPRYWNLWGQRAHVELGWGKIAGHFIQPGFKWRNIIS